MALVPWKAGLPDCPQSWSESEETQVIETSVDVGPPKVRRRSTLSTKIVQVTWTLAANTYDLFVEFFETDCLQGINEFEYVHPITKTVNRYRFAEAPNYQFIGGANGVAAIRVSAQWVLQ